MAQMRLTRGIIAIRHIQPERSIDHSITIVGPDFPPQAQSYPAGAVLCAMLYEHGGTAALKSFLLAGPTYTDLRAVLQQLLGRPWAQIVTDWRATVSRLAAAPSGST